MRNITHLLLCLPLTIVLSACSGDTVRVASSTDGPVTTIATIPNIVTEQPITPSSESAPVSIPVSTPVSIPVSTPGPTIEQPSEIIVPGNTVFTPSPSDITKSRSFYNEDGYDAVNVIRVDVVTNTVAGICTVDDQSGCTLDDVLADIDGSDDLTVEIPVHFSADDFVNDGSTVNAELRQRGASTRTAVQKSFRIKLDSKDVLWRNERRLQLNKHPFDRSRIRNKLSFDLMRELPHLPSLRSQFVNLWIDDGSGPVDQGLYTHIEAPVKEYLVNRGRDKDDNLYKAEQFYFSPADLALMQIDEAGSPVNLDQFETRLEIKRGENHTLLVQMLTELNNPELSFAAVFDQYFNKNNVLMWMSANFLLGQQDVSSHNFYLYNPKGSEKFYFLPWDYDAAIMVEATLANTLETSDIEARLGYGYARFIDSVFIAKYLREPGAHQRILAAVDEIRNVYLTTDLVARHTKRYAEVVRPYLRRSPDLENIAGVRELQKFDVYDQLIESMPGFIDQNHQRMRDDFSVPLPPFLKLPLIRSNEIIMQWLPAYDVTGNALTYDLEVASSPQFTPATTVVRIDGIADSEGIVQQSIDRSLLPSGVWYFRVIARVETNAERFWSIAHNQDLLQDGEVVYGVREFTVP